MNGANRHLDIQPFARSSTGSWQSHTRVAIPGTCGELVQGTYGGSPSLISCPIERYSIADVRLSTARGWTVSRDAAKVRSALRIALHQFGKSAIGGHVRIHSRLPRGRGYASSTADIGAALFALYQALGVPPTPEEIARIAVAIEPTDSTLFPGLALWDHRSGNHILDLGPAPNVSVVVIDPGGIVDTGDFNRRDHAAALRELETDHATAFNLVIHGIRRNELEALGEGATLSATAHQRILANPLLEPALRLARTEGALGICRAHSGTLIGLLVDRRLVEPAWLVARARQQLGDSVEIYECRLANGGPRLLAAQAGRVADNAGPAGSSKASTPRIERDRRVA